MASSFWDQLRATGAQPPEGDALADLTTELTRMLGHPDPEVRTGIAVPTLRAWVRAGVYDELLRGLGDGMTAGLAVGLGAVGGDTVLRRAGSVAVLAECLERDTAVDALGRSVVLEWGDRLAGWLVRERDLRADVPDRGAAAAVGCGADAVGALLRSPRIEPLEVVVLLDVLADRVLLPESTALDVGQVDRLAAACMAGLGRDAVAMDVLEPWVARIADAAVPAVDQDAAALPAQAFLRSLHLQLALADHPPGVRADLLLVLIAHLRNANRELLVRPRGLGSRP